VRSTGALTPLKSPLTGLTLAIAGKILDAALAEAVETNPKPVVAIWRLRKLAGQSAPVGAPDGIEAPAPSKSTVCSGWIVFARSANCICRNHTIWWVSPPGAADEQTRPYLAINHSRRVSSHL
jgi:hypothetical protein